MDIDLENTATPSGEPPDETNAAIAPTEAETNDQEKVTVEEFKVSGDALVAKIKELIHQGNIRRIIIKNQNGHTLIEIPMTVGVIGGAIGAVIFPVVAAVAVIGAMVTHLTVVIERQASSQSSDSEDYHDSEQEA
ncbi:MAG: DUF4342 domain-containing protein [Cyanobacteria bacterium P01_A01_bin.123]